MKSKIFFGIIVVLVLAILIYGISFAIDHYRSLMEGSENISFQNNLIDAVNSQNQENELNSSTNNEIIEVTIPEDDDNIPEYDFYFELPINGATGYASIDINVTNKPNSSKVIKTLSAGQGFTIISEDEDWWQIKVDNTTGWVNTKYCMINLPDIMPSIIYDDTNSYKSLFRSSEISIPNITGKQLYNAYKYNKRLSKDEFLMPIIYSMAKKIMDAQTAALEDGYSLKIYETFRPYETQKAVCKNLKELISENKTVYDGIYGGGWSEDWFISQSISNHQKGVAMDVSLVKVNETKIKTTGDYKYLTVTDYSECKMPTKMHELSDAAITFQYGVPASSKTEWKEVPLAKTMTSDAKRLQKYCTGVGLTPLSSEWWHFNDLDTRSNIGENYSTGKYNISKCYSTVPN